MKRLLIYLLLVAGSISCSDSKNLLLSVQNVSEAHDSLSVTVSINGKEVYSGIVPEASTDVDYVGGSFDPGDDSLCVDVSVEKGKWTSHKCGGATASSQIIVGIDDRLSGKAVDSMMLIPIREGKELVFANPSISITFIENPGKKPL